MAEVGNFNMPTLETSPKLSPAIRATWGRIYAMQPSLRDMMTRAEAAKGDRFMKAIREIARG